MKIFYLHVKHLYGEGGNWDGGVDEEFLPLTSSDHLQAWKYQTMSIVP